jgi:hypothetical protein
VRKHRPFRKVIPPSRWNADAVPGKREFSTAFTTFVNKYITSIEQIEVLLILRAQPERVWTVDELSDTFRSSPKSIASRLEALREANFVTGNRDAGYRYSGTEYLRKMVDELHEAYITRRFSVIELVFSHDAARSFADAFTLRKEDDEERG